MIPSMTGSYTRTTFAFGLGAALTILPAAAQERLSALPPSPSKTACLGSLQPDTLQALTAEGDLRLASNGLSRLSGIRLPEDPRFREQALAWLRAHAGQPLTIDETKPRDRWGRLPVRVHLAANGQGLDLAHGLVEQGLALVDAGPDPAFCQPELLALEETARERHLGLWAEGRYNPLPVDQTDRLQERIGSFVIVEGRVRSVGERKQQTYLNFGGHWAEDFTIIIPRKTWTLMTDRGMGAEALKGQRVRARGILQSWQGTALTIVIPDMIERLEGNRLAR
jgi:hypothetical protein